MFCSNCGKTLSPDDISCPHCGAVVGDSRFDGHPYTGAQVRTRPGEAVRVPLNHTRTTYMGSEQPEESEIDARTTYRATRGGKVPKYAARRESFADEDALYEDAPEADYDEDYADDYAYDAADDYAGDTAGDYAEDAAGDYAEDAAGDYAEDAAGGFEGETAYTDADYAEAGDEAPDYAPEQDSRSRADGDYALDDADLGESEDERPAKRKSRASKRAAAAKAKPDAGALEDDDIDPDELRARDIKIPKKGRISEDVRRHMRVIDEVRVEQEMADARPKKKLSINFGKKRAANESEFDEDVFSMEDDALPDEAYEGAPEDEDIDISEDELLDDLDLDYKPRRKRNKALSSAIKYSIAAALIVCMLAGIIVGLSYLTDKTKTAPIEGVSVSLYEEGVRLIESRVTEEYRDRMLNLYTGTESSEAVFLNAITTDLDSLAKLMPESPAINDRRFVSALESIQHNINNALKNHVQMAKAANTGEQPAQDVESQWQFVVNLVNSFKQATTTALLDAIISGERINVIELATPTPPPVVTTVTYNTLSTGAKGDSVKALQERLILLGYLEDVADGSFGPKTAAAVKLFEQYAGLDVDGIADEEMQKRLFRDDAPLKR